MPLPAKGPGRPPGSLAKMNYKFSDTLEKHGINIAEDMKDELNRARENKDWRLAFDILSMMAQYVYPKLKTVEHTHLRPTDGMTPEQQLEAMRLAVRALEAKLGGPA
jgi:hypothetical protein